MALERLKPLLYWVNIAERYLPPGLDPRTRLGPKRARAAGLNVDFPREQEYPKFLLRFADIDLALAGENLAAGSYRAQAAGLTTEPSLYGRPMQFVLQRSGGQVGPRTARVFAQLDHSRVPIRDSLVGGIGGLALPSVPLAALGARVSLGQGTSELTLSRSGENLLGRWRVRTTDASWQKLDSVSAAAGSQVADRAKGVVEDLVWRTLSGIREVEIEAEIAGTVRRPAFSVRSNIASVVASSLKRAVGEEVAKAEQMVRARVDSLVAGARREVDERVAVLQTEVQGRVAQQRQELEQVKAELEARVREMTPRLPGGIRLPGS
jgi:hypothetical protein